MSRSRAIISDVRGGPAACPGARLSQPLTGTRRCVDLGQRLTALLQVVGGQDAGILSQVRLLSADKASIELSIAMGGRRAWRVVAPGRRWVRQAVDVRHRRSRAAPLLHRAESRVRPGR